jgi:hypothetical protein
MKTRKNIAQKGNTNSEQVTDKAMLNKKQLNAVTGGYAPVSSKILLIVGTTTLPEPKPDVFEQVKYY